mgnify:CR=1 FL=1
MNILVIGEGCRDIYRYGDSTRLCPEAPVPVLNVDQNKVSINSGMAMNVYNNIKSLTDNDDVDIVTNDGWQNVTKTRYVDSKTNYLILRVDQNDEIERCDVKKIDLSKYDCVVISDYNKGFLLEEDIEYISKNHNLTFLDTKKILGDWCNNITYIKINENEYNKTKHMLDKNIDTRLIITLGSQGAKYLNKTYPVSEVEIKDTSGAGDTFVAALCVEYTKTKDIDSSIRFANNCATQVVQRKGVSVACV